MEGTGTGHQDQLQSALSQVLSVRAGIQELTQTLLQGDVAAGAPSEAAASLLQDVSTRVQQLGCVWGGVSKEIADLKAQQQQQQQEAQGPPRVHAATALPSWWQGPLQHHLQQELQQHYYELPPLPPFTQPASNQPYGSDALKAALQSVRSLCPEVILQVCSSTGVFGISTRDAAEVRLGCPPVFCAGIVLAQTGNPEPLRVTVDAYSQAPNLDPWSLSPQLVFKAISATGMRALTHFQRSAACRASLECKPGVVPQARASQAGAEALEDLLLWLLSYRNLFTQPSTVDGQLLVNEPMSLNPVPPLFRPYKVPREALRVHAIQGSPSAMHMHSVWEE
eukprot:CAMPEP_0202352924 /NCGR_PEP_ID=MMETSP1126-20121109/8910_1 /ASSEMBLY_ACC=CAM_ASM_000457 /TAXON_ID=3047 /ORGANISM="Dunaliella tertiolecta, Strain CCMP1320" /LENGTH=336 /DNA_ID=CAMNT_0048945209 /DNA_START=109 /DNA_END=1119 /DNA_ORIENTATION=+